MQLEKVEVEFKLENDFIDLNGQRVQLDPNNVLLPNKQRQEDAGYDIISAEEGIIPPGEGRTFHTGVRLAVALGWYYEIKGRSGLGFKGIQPFIGTLDATYNGLIRVQLLNHSAEPYKVNRGDRIAQILFHKQYEMAPHKVTEFSSDFDKRGTAGFGSSGK